MKLFICVFLVLAILEEYQCEPCLDWFFGRRSRGNGREKKLGISAGFRAKTTISGRIEHTHEDDHRPSYYPPNGYPQYNPNVMGNGPRYQPDFLLHGYPSHRQNGLGHRASYPYRPYYPPSMYPSHGTPYSTHYGTPWYHPGSFGPKYDRPRYDTLYPTPFDTVHKTPNVAPNGSAYGAPNGSPNSTPNGRPAQTPVETDDGTPPKKHFFVTPTGIQETPAQPVDDIAS